MEANICLEPIQPYYPVPNGRGITTGRMPEVGPRRAMLRLALLPVIAVGLVVLLLGPQADAGSESVATVSHVVKAGETLWSIASAHTAPGEDVRRTVALIRSANGMPSGTVKAGVTIAIPVGDITGWGRSAGS
ncbi:MAG: LysM peptidoglycan-binding domain-containing protein [Acidimicrobiia bacterium]|nr:LysM peptidoglycan-binding domain-containing protein [Acidimicrobiia bacterium]